jgi:putative DNA-invertase from lambdoid prophage Rac
MTLRVATYHRVSTTEQHPDGARAELRDAAARLGGTLVAEVEETGSGARHDRPGLGRIRDLAQRGKIDVVIAWKLDRLGRSALDLLATIRDLEVWGVRVLVCSQGIDIRPGGDAMSRLLLTMLAAVAEFERDLIRERTRMGLERARRMGRELGRPRVARPDASAVAELRARGRTWRQVAEELGVSVHAARVTCEKGAAAERSETES